jgi:hypothetical protein
VRIKILLRIIFQGSRRVRSRFHRQAYKKEDCRFGRVGKSAQAAM